MKGSNGFQVDAQRFIGFISRCRQQGKAELMRGAILLHVLSLGVWTEPVTPPQSQPDAIPVISAMLSIDFVWNDCLLSTGALHSMLIVHGAAKTRGKRDDLASHGGIHIHAPITDNISYKAAVSHI